MREVTLRLLQRIGTDLWSVISLLQQVVHFIVVYWNHLILQCYEIRKAFTFYSLLSGQIGVFRTMPLPEVFVRPRQHSEEGLTHGQLLHKEVS